MNEFIQENSNKRRTKTGKISVIKPNNAFGRWLNENLHSYNLQKIQLAARSGRGQSSISQLIGGERRPSRTMVADLARGLIQPGLAKDEADKIYQKLLREGMAAAGYAQADEENLYGLISFVSRKYVMPLSGGRQAQLEMPMDATQQDFEAVEKLLSFIKEAHE